MVEKLIKMGIVVALIAAVGAVFALKKGRSSAAVKAAASQATTSQPAAAVAALPRLLDLGSTSCIPCKMMMPILEEVKAEQAGRLDVEFIDVWKDEAAGQAYGVKVIPTQIFFDAAGKEIWRHEGFLAKADILAKWSELGISLPAPESR